MLVLIGMQNTARNGGKSNLSLAQSIATRLIQNIYVYLDIHKRLAFSFLSVSFSVCT